jgi:hypothetical protein
MQGDGESGGQGRVDVFAAVEFLREEEEED